MKPEDARGWLGDRLGSARADAERIVRELVGRGLLTRGQEAEIAAAVDDAIARGHELVATALREPQRVLDALRFSVSSRQSPDATPASTSSAQRDASPERTVHARIDALEARVALLEAALGAAGLRTRRGSEGD